MKEEIKKLKKIELHIHLDGSMSINLASTLSGLSIKEVKEKMEAEDKCLDLHDYLTKFDFPLSLMQTSKNLEMVAYDLAKRLADDNIIYAEIRFAPMFHTKECLSYEEIVDSVLKGLNKEKRIKTKLILCLMRGMSERDNLKTIEIAAKYINKGVGGVDLAGDESHFPLKDYQEFFILAKAKGIPFTIHAGEVLERDIKLAIKLGAKRIGHGVKCINDENLIKLIKEKNVLLEICPTSNIQTNAFENYSHHPIYDLYQKGLNISINTDNMSVSKTTLTNEYLKLLQNFNFTLEDFKKMNINSLNYTFLSNLEKAELLEEMLK